MRKTLLVGDREMDFLSNGATCIYYRNIFHEDFLAIFQKMEEGTVTEAEATFSLQKLAYIMNLQARCVDGDANAKSILMSGKNPEAFIEWASEFAPMDLPLASEKILMLYIGDLEELEKAKKE